MLDFWPFGSLLVFNFSYLLLFVVPSCKTLLHAAYILFRPNWAQELSELKCEMETWDTYVPTHFHLIEIPVLANGTEMPSQTALCKSSGLPR